MWRGFERQFDDAAGGPVTWQEAAGRLGVESSDVAVIEVRFNSDCLKSDCLKSKLDLTLI